MSANQQDNRKAELLANPDDDRTRSVFDDGLRYHTDRILIRARKP